MGTLAVGGGGTRWLLVSHTRISRGRFMADVTGSPWRDGCGWWSTSITLPRQHEPMIESGRAPPFDQPRR